MKKTWVVAVSGGPDSMMLLDVLHKKGIQCIAAHVNYHKRDTSDRDMNIVKAYAEKHNIPLRVKHFDAEVRDNFQTAARVFRYQFFRDIVKESNAIGVAVAHHLDDDVETYIFQKERNMKSDSIGLNERQHIENTEVWRPLLSLSKKEIIEYCETHRIQFGIDESNLELDYTRNKIRHTLSMLSSEEYKDLITEMYIEKAEHQKYVEDLEKTIEDWGTKVPIDMVESTDLLRYWLRKQGVPIHETSERHLEEMLKAFHKNKGVYEFDEWIVNAQYGYVFLGKLQSVYDTHTSFELGDYHGYRFSNKGLKIQGLVLEEKDFPIIVRNARKNDKIRMRYGTKLLSRHFIDRKIPLIERKNCLVIENSLKQIVFVVGLGSDIHHYANNMNNFVIEL